MPTLKVTKDVDSVCRALVKQYNRLHEDTVADDGYVHSDKSGVMTSVDYTDPESKLLQVEAADATDLATSVTLTNALRAVMMEHFDDDVAHRVADSTSVGALDGYADAEDLDDVQDQLNVMQHTFNAHLDRAVSLVKCHLNDDDVNEVTTAAATNQATSNTLANDLKSALNAHIDEGPNVGKIKLI